MKKINKNILMSTICIATSGIIAVATPILIDVTKNVNSNESKTFSVLKNSEITGTKVQNIKKVDPNQILNSTWYDREFVLPQNMPKTNNLTLNLYGATTHWQKECGSKNTPSGFYPCRTVVSVNSKPECQITVNLPLLQFGSNYKQLLNEYNIYQGNFNINEFKQQDKNRFWLNTNSVSYYVSTSTGHTLTSTGSSPTGRPTGVTKHNNPYIRIKGIDIGSKYYNATYPSIQNDSIFSNISTDIDAYFENDSKLREIDQYSQTEFNLDKLLMVDQAQSFQTFADNRLKIGANNDYLKSLIYFANNINKANELVKNSTVEQRSNEQWVATINALVEGKIYDTTNPIFNTLGVNIEDLGGFTNTLDYLLNKVAVGYDVINEINNIPSNFLMNNAIKYNIDVTDPYLAFKLNNVLLKNVNNEYYSAFKFKLDFNYDGNNFSKDVELKYDVNQKEFKLFENNKDFNVIVQESRNAQHSFNIKNIQLLNANNDVATQSENNLGLYNENKIVKPANSDDQGLQITNKFNLSNLINLKQNWTLAQLQEINGNKPLTKDEISKPSLLLKKESFKQNLLDFKKVYSWGTAALDIIDPIIDEEALNVTGDSLLNNSNLQKYFDNFEIEAFDSVNGLEVKLAYKNLERTGELRSDSSIIKDIRFQTTNTTGKSFDNQVKANEINNYKYDDTKTAEQNVLQNLIAYDGENKANVLLSTNYSYNDWNVNSLTTKPKINTKTDNAITGFITYKQTANAANWLNKVDLNNSNSRNVLRNIEQRLDFNVKFNTPIASDSNPTNQIDLWIIIGCSVGGAALLVGLAIYYFYKKKKLNKFEGEDLDDDEN